MNSYRQPGLVNNEHLHKINFEEGTPTSAPATDVFVQKPCFAAFWSCPNGTFLGVGFILHATDFLGATDSLPFAGHLHNCALATSPLQNRGPSYKRFFCSDIPHPVLPPVYPSYIPNISPLHAQICWFQLVSTGFNGWTLLIYSKISTQYKPNKHPRQIQSVKLETTWWIWSWSCEMGTSSSAGSPLEQSWRSGWWKKLFLIIYK